MHTRIIAMTMALGLLATPGFAADTSQQNNMKSCAASWKAMPAADQSKTKYKDYMSTCLKAPAKAAAAPVAAPVMAAAPAKAVTAMKMATPESGIATCKDGKTVAYKHHSGTCSGHGGVASW